MASKIYTNYKRIQSIIDKNNLLQATFTYDMQGDGEDLVHVPLSEVFLKEKPQGNSQDSYMDVYFNTVELQLGLINDLDYDLFTSYLKRNRDLDDSDIDEVKIDENNNTTVLSYGSGRVTTFVRCVKEDFNISGKHFSIIKIRDLNEGTLSLLLSPDIKAPWLTKLAMDESNLTKATLKNVLKLLDMQLLGYPNSVDFKTPTVSLHNRFTYQDLVQKDDDVTVRTNNSSFTFNMDKAKSKFSNGEKNVVLDLEYGVQGREPTKLQISFRSNLVAPAIKTQIS